jgi:uncharacterized ion transporter superfamily protein YfcC
VVKGAGDFIGVGLIIVLARGITVIMNNSDITDTILHSMEKLVSDSSSGLFGGLMFLINIPLAFLVPSTSGHAALAMPILAPLADFAGVSRAMVITAYQSASGLVNLVTPTSAVVMGGLALAKVRYDQYLKFIGPLLAILSCSARRSSLSVPRSSHNSETWLCQWRAPVTGALRDATSESGHD